MNNIHCEPHETGISFEYAMHQASQKTCMASVLQAFFVWIEPSRGTGPRATVGQRTSRGEP